MNAHNIARQAAAMEAVKRARRAARLRNQREGSFPPSEGSMSEEQRTEQSSAPLTFAALREANVQRLPLFKNPHGEPAHSEPDGSDWSLGEWCNAVLGELGEAANLIKKVRRGDLTLDEARPALAKEYADVVTYLDILAFRTGVDLGEATVAKWDEVSERVGVALRLSAASRSSVGASERDALVHAAESVIHSGREPGAGRISVDAAAFDALIIALRNIPAALSQEARP